MGFKMTETSWGWSLPCDSGTQGNLSRIWFVKHLLLRNLSFEPSSRLQKTICLVMGLPSTMKDGRGTAASLRGRIPTLCAQLLSCVRLCDLMDWSLSGSSVRGNLPVRILEWVAMPYSRVLPNPGIEPRSPALQADSFPSEPPGKPCLPCCPMTNQFYS